MVLEEGPQNTVTFSVTPRDDGTLDVFVGTIGRTPSFFGLTYSLVLFYEDGSCYTCGFRFRADGGW